MNKKSNFKMTRVAIIGTGIVFIIDLLLALEKGMELSLGVICAMAVIMLSYKIWYDEIDVERWVTA